MADFSDRALDRLREQLRATMSQKRFAHTLGVEQTVSEMAALYCPHKTGMLRAAALLHDCTKEYSDKETKAVLSREGMKLRSDEKESPQILHAITAPTEIARLYPELADEELLSCVRWHTTGREGMTVPEALLYLADVIEATRTHESCCVLREFFWHSLPVTDDTVEQTLHLCRTMVRSFDMTIQRLLEKHLPVCADTVLARSCFLDRLAVLERN